MNLVKNKTYREIDALNQSMISKFIDDPSDFYRYFVLKEKRPDNSTWATIVGDLVDFYLIDCDGNEEEFNQRFGEKFSLFGGTKTMSQVFYLADVLFQISKRDMNEEGVVTTEFSGRFKEALARLQKEGKFKGKSEEQALVIFNEKGKDYFDELIKNFDKTVVDIHHVEKAKFIVRQLMNDPFTSELFDSTSSDIKKKMFVEWEYEGTHREISCKSEIDLAILDHSSKKFYLYDLKTTYDNEAFEQSFLKRKYFIQAYFYKLAAEYWLKESGLYDYEVVPMQFIVADTSKNNRRPLIYRTSEELMQKIKCGFKSKGYSFRGFDLVMDDILWAIENDIFTISRKNYMNNGIIDINLFDYGQDEA